MLVETTPAPFREAGATKRITILEFKYSLSARVENILPTVRSLRASRPDGAPVRTILSLPRICVRRSCELLLLPTISMLDEVSEGNRLSLECFRQIGRGNDRSFLMFIASSIVPRTFRLLSYVVKT